MKSKRLKLINCDATILNSILKGNKALAKSLQIKVPENWTEFGKPIFEYSLNQITIDPESKIWWTYLPINIETNTLIGSCGYKGKPDKNGMVEIGYEVAKTYRNLGFATEIANLLLAKAFQKQMVKLVKAHTLAQKNASVKVLQKCGFLYVKELEDEEDGKIWQWIKEK